MNRVFEFDNETDDIYDPGKIIEVQELVRELVKGNAHRQDELQEQILAKGAWAITGLINSTLVYMHEMKDTPTQELIAALMCRLAADNPTVRDVIFRSGAVESPFPEPRSIAIRALEKLDWRPSEEQQRQIQRRLTEMQRIEDDQGELDMYRLLVRSRKDSILNALLNTCKSWIGEKKRPGALLALLVDNHPQQADRIISEVFLAADEESFRKDANLAQELTRPLGGIAFRQKWLQSDLLLHVTVEVLEGVSWPRHTAVEFLWTEAVSGLKLSPVEEQQRVLQQFGETVRAGEKLFSKEDAVESLYRYWFKAVGSLGALDYMNECAQSRDEMWGTYAILQLMFLTWQKNNSQAEKYLGKLEKKCFDQYQSAKDIYDAINDPGHIVIRDPKPRPGWGRGERKTVGRLK